MEGTEQDDRYQEAIAEFGSALERLASAYESDPEKRRDLSQDIHFQVWRSFQRYDARCSRRTWIYRVAHNAAVSHVMRERRTFSAPVSLEELESLADQSGRHLFRNVLQWSFGPLVLAVGGFILTLVMIGIRSNAPALVKMVPFLTGLVIWMILFLIFRSRGQRDLQRECDELNDIDKEKYETGDR